MPNAFGIVPVRFGEAAPNLVEGKTKDFYDWVAQAVSGDTCSLVATQNTRLLTMAFSFAELREQASGGYAKLHDYAAEWIEQVDLIVVDLLHRPTRPSRVNVSILSGLHDLIEEHKGRVARLIFLLPSLPDENAPIFTHLTKGWTDVDVKIATLDGHTFSLDKGLIVPTKSIPFETQIRERYRNANPAPIVGLRHKMVAKRGHFSADTSGCVNVIFDGYSCEAELVQLFSKYLDEQLSPIPTTVAYHVVSSKWLESPIRAAADAKKIAVTNIDDPNWNDSLKNIQAILLILPLIDSLKTVATLIRRLRAHGYSGKLNILSVLSTDGELESFGERSVTVGTEELQIGYFLKVSAIRDPFACLQCQLQIPITAHDHTEYDQIRALHFWQMASFWQPEPVKETPVTRSAEHYLPNFSRMVDQHGAWIAQKFHTIIAKELGDSWSERSPDFSPILVFFPEEDAAKQLAFYVGSLKGFNTVSIGRKALENVEPGLSAGKNVCDSDLWRTQIDGSDPYTRIILLEEFARSGGTKSLLQRALQSIGRRASIHITIIDFRPFSERKDESLKTISLYDCPLGGALCQSE